MREDHPAAPEEKKASSKGIAFSSIQGRLVGLLLLVLVPILLAQAYFSYDRYQSKIRVESEANLQLARATAKSFDTFVQDVLHQEMAIGLAFTSSQTLSEKEKSRILLESQAGNRAIWHFFWYNPAGIVTAATGSQFIGMDISDREFYREIVAGKDWVVSDLLLSKKTQQPSFTISRGIRNERGELLGMIAAGILPANLDRVLAIERPGDAGVSLLDSKGMNAYRYPAIQYTWEQRNWLKAYPIIGEVLKGKEVVTFVKSDRTGKNRIVAFTPVPSVGWIATCSRAEEEVLGPIISATLQEIGLIVLVGLVSILTAFALSRAISTSVKSLRNYALSLGQGETQNCLTISRPAEIKDLAEAFNKMTEEIRSREKSLRESEQRYSTLFANKINGMAHCRIITDEHGHPVDYIILQINEAYERIIGIKKADIEGLRVTVVFPDIKEYALDYIGLLGKVALESSEIKFEDYFEATRQCLSIYAYSPLPGEFITIITDVSERKQAEAALEASAEQLRLLADSIPNLTFWANSNGYITWYNRRWYEYTGTTPEQMEGWGWQNVHDPNELPKVLERWQASIATGEPFEMTFPLRSADGVFRLFLTRILPLKDAAGVVQQWLGTNTDVSELKCVEEALRVSEQHLRSHVENTPLAVVEWDKDFIVTRWAGAAETMFGWSAGETLGKPIADLNMVYEPDMPIVQDTIAKMTDGKRQVVSSNRNKIKDGRVINCIWYNSVQLDEQGKMASVLSLVLDVTEGKYAEEQIKASLAEKEVLLKEIHHRVKNNLQVISSLLGLQSDGSKDETVRQVLRDVTYRVRSMAMVHEKLYQSNDLAHIDFAEYTRSLLSYLLSAYGAVASTVKMTLDLEPVSLTADTAVSCGLILNELVVNAFEHAFQGQSDGEMKVSLHCGADRRISLCVADNGIGLPTGLDWRKTSSLGLRLVQMLARQMDATAEVSSGDGTKFEIIFKYPDTPS